MYAPFKSIVVTYCCGGWPYTYIYIYIYMYIYQTDNTHIRQKIHEFSVLYVYCPSYIYTCIYIYIRIYLCVYGHPPQQYVTTTDLNGEDMYSPFKSLVVTHCCGESLMAAQTLQHTATHLQHTATHCDEMLHIARQCAQHTATHCNRPFVSDGSTETCCHGGGGKVSL